MLGYLYAIYHHIVACQKDETVEDRVRGVKDLGLSLSTHFLVMNDIKEQTILLPHMSSTRDALYIELEYEGCDCLKHAAPNDRFELWLRGPALQGGETVLELKKAKFTANVGSYSSQQYVKVCLDSKVFRGEQNLELRQSVHQPHDLLRVSDSMGDYKPLTDADEDKVKLLPGMSSTGVAYRLSPVYENYPDGIVGQKTFPVSVLGKTKGGRFGFRLVSNIKVQDVPRLHWYFPNAQLDVPVNQLHFPKRDTPPRPKERVCSLLT